MDVLKLNIEVVGGEEEILEFISLCAKIQMLGTYGTCDTIPLIVDGDGSGKLNFNIRAKVGGEENVDMVEAWKTFNLKHFKEEIDGGKLKEHWIGE